MTKFFKPSLNGDRELSDFTKREILRLKCDICSNEWTSTKQAFTLTPKCKRCEAVKKSVETIYPEIKRYCKEDLISETPKSNKYITSQCPQCNTWFKKTISSFVKDFSCGEDPCGRCNPRHRVRNGIMFLKNNPEFSSHLLSPLGEREDIPESTQEKFKWRKSCGHIEELRPQDFLLRPEICAECSQPHKDTSSAFCTVCENLIKLSRVDKNYFLKDSKNFKCKACREFSRVENNSLSEKIKEWKSVKWSAENSLNIKTVSASSAKRVIWECLQKGHTFDRYAYSSLDSCPKCEGSSLELIVSSMFEDVNNLRIVRNDRKIIAPLELDFYFPDHKIAIEVNGLYWHSSTKNTDQRQHKNKFDLCQSKGIQLLTIWEDDILSNPNIIQSMLLHKLGRSKKSKISARDCTIQEISPKEAKRFYEANHIQGYSRSTITYGLFTASQELVAAMSFIISANGAELTRYATSEIIRGGFTKLLKNFIKNHPEVSVIKSFSDNCVSDGSIYRENGFKKDAEIRPDYSYLVGRKRVHKFNYRIERFRTDPELKFKNGLTESQLAKLNNLPRVWDCGKIRWVLRTTH